MDVIPKPLISLPREGAFVVSQNVSIACSAAVEPVARYLASELRRQLGVTLSVVVGGDSAGGILLELDPSLPLAGGASESAAKEAYTLDVTQSGVRITAREQNGLFYGVQTLVAAARAGAGQVRAERVVDAPRFAWRGAHLDVARHFYPVEFVKRFIDLMALHKLNVFHWHLTEDQGWRIAIDSFPRLTEISAYRDKNGERYGGFYTKDEVREVVAYAAERFIEVVPEIEMPGHAVAALAAYPELSCTGGPFTVETRWGIFDDVYCAGSDQAVEFLEKVLDEVIELFPSEFFHIGGDECPKTRWKTCERCQARMRAEGLKNEDELQSWFVSRMSRYLEKKGKRLVGWDEILEGGLAKGATVMSWRGTSGGIEAARLGHDVIMTPTTACYLDYKQAQSEDEPGAPFAKALPLETVYAYEPVPTELSAEEAVHVIGVQGNIWTERMPSEAHVEYMTFPRLSALAEVAWSSPARDFADFERRLTSLHALLDAWKVGYRGSLLAKPVRPTPAERLEGNVSVSGTAYV